MPLDSALLAVQNLRSWAIPPNFVVYGGDMIYEGEVCNPGHCEEQLPEFLSFLNSNPLTKLIPYHMILGNHDVIGWDAQSTPITKQEACQRKNDAICALGFPDKKSHYSYVQGPWTFLFLDDIQYDGVKNSPFYPVKPCLDDSQFDWLEEQLGSAKNYVCIVSHYPIQVSADTLARRKVTGCGTDLHQDQDRLIPLFKTYGNVKVCLSGHLHRKDDLYDAYTGTNYYCNPALCGNWWHPNDGCTDPAGYTIVDFYDDGSADNKRFYYSPNICT